MDDLKKIIAVFVKKDAADITDSTPIRKGIAGSILIHRMYAAINSAGYKVENYANINTYGELLSALNIKSQEVGDRTVENITVDTSEPLNINYITQSGGSTTIGVDIENIANLPQAVDFREHEFYVNNFSTEEIAYSLLSTNPYETFAGLFSAKEALCKANNSLRDWPFNKISISHTPAGKPVFQDYSISISHTKDHAVAVALLNTVADITATPIAQEENKGTDLFLDTPIVEAKINNAPLYISLLSMAITLVLLYLLLAKHYNF